MALKKHITFIIYKLHNYLALLMLLKNKPCGKEKYGSINIMKIEHKKQENKEETLTKKMKRSPDERHTQTNRNVIETF